MSDVIVIGGGVIGCAVACELSRRGLSITLAEPRAIGAGASQASAGMLAPYTEGRHDRVLQALGVRSLALYDDLVASLASEGHHVTYNRSGSLDIALDDDAADQLAELAKAAGAEGTDCELIDAAALRAMEPVVSPRARGALRLPAHGYVSVSGLVEATWNSAVRRSAQLRRGVVRSVKPGHGTVRVLFDDGPQDAPYVVMAAGSWSGAIDVDGVLPLPVRPVRGQLVALSWPSVSPRHTLWGPGCYAVPWPDGTLLVGATVEEVGFAEQPTAGGVQGLLNAITELTPDAAGATFTGVRVGLRPATPDDRPIVGASTRVEGLVYATGHYRNGALLAPLTAHAVADLIGGHPLDAAWEPCAPARFGQ